MNFSQGTETAAPGASQIGGSCGSGTRTAFRRSWRLRPRSGVGMSGAPILVGRAAG